MRMCGENLWLTPTQHEMRMNECLLDVCVSCIYLQAAIRLPFRRRNAKVRKGRPEMKKASYVMGIKSAIFSHLYQDAPDVYLLSLLFL